MEFTVKYSTADQASVHVWCHLRIY